MIRILLAAWVFVVAGVAVRTGVPQESRGKPAEPITLETLLDEMVDLDRLADFPSPPFACRQFSSYDRASKSPEVDWFANGDRGHYLRVEERDGRQEFVMMDAEGPGAVVRIWSANPAGVLRVYLDGGEAPVLEAPMTDFLGGKIAELPPPITGERSRGWNSYFPIPYARHCKITSDAGDFYYHVNTRTYAPGTKVESFSRDGLGAAADRVRRTAERLSGEGLEAPIEFAGAERGVFWGKRRLEPGATFEIPLAQGPCAIREIVAKIDAADLEQAMRHTILSIRFDGETTVEVPLGDFFGSAPGITPYASRPISVLPGGEMRSRWVMPYREEAQISVENRGSAEVEVGISGTGEPRPWTDRSMHFHAKWRAERDAPTRPMRDWNYLEATGKGVFVGAAFSIANPVKAWWGEGDEKIYVDGETFPSHFGTGTEDYYGYAWCWPVPFSHAYHGQPRCDGPGNYGHTSVHRWHILDRIPFERDFRFDMELWHWNAECRVDMAVTAYWYARPGATDGFAPIRTEDLALRVLPPYEPPRVAGAIEGEGMRIVEKTGDAVPQEIGGCSGEAHLWWREGQKPGDHLVLAFDVKDAGRYRVLARFVRAADYGIHQLSLDGKPIGESIDFYHDGVVLSDEVDFGVHELAAGEHRLDVCVVGANEKAIRKFMFGLDYVRLERVSE